MAIWRTSVLVGMALLAMLLVALHAPGQMSVDTGVALYEGLVGRAIGWGPPFFAAVLRWLGGGEIGAAVFVAANTAAIYGCFATLLTAGVLAPASLRGWRRPAALLLVLNPLFAFYAGILWKDVMLATCAMVAASALLVAGGRRGRTRAWLLGLTFLAIAPMPLLRQQGALLSVPLAIAGAWAFVDPLRDTSTRARRAGIAVAILALSACSTLVLDRLSATTVRPKPASPVSVGLATIRAYDIAGMIAYARPGDPVAWSGADAATRQQIRYYYDPNRIDTMWRDPFTRKYFDGLGEGLPSIWWAGLRHDPVAYASHRVAALRTLMGFEDVVACVPAYWGVASLAEYLEPLGLREEMDQRDRLIGHLAGDLAPTPVFRNWFYALLLLAGGVAALRRRGGDAFTLRATAIAGAVYLASFVPATIACDFRYLYPVACLATVICTWMLLRPANAPGAVNARAS